MSGGGGRGRGYSGRHHLRSPRPGGGGPAPLPAPTAGPTAPDTDEEAARTLAELSPRSTGTPNPIKMDMLKDIKNKDADMEKDRRDEIYVKEIKYAINAEDDKQLQELLAIDEQYAPLLALLEQFSPGEDGIQFNRKLRQFESTITTMCPDEARLHGVFSTFRAAALSSSSVARQLAAVGASFTRQQRQQLLRAALLNVVMQGTFSKLDLLERVNPIYLINAANLMGDYFAEARLCNGNKVHILAGPLLQYLRALLASDDIRAHRSLATQLMLNGRELLSVLAQELDDLSISIRLRLLSPPPVSIIWLLLSADLCLNKFLPLPNTLQQFYASHLELSSDENYSEVTYGSWKKEKEDYKSDVSNDLSDKMSHNLSQISLTQDDDPKPKLRPILGAGAGLLRQEQALSVSQDTFETWTPKSSLTKRYDLNSWRQNEEEKQEEVDPVFNPSVLPPNLQNFNTGPTVTAIPDYPPPNRYNNYPENFSNYLQQGDGTYIQNQYQNNTNFSSQGDFVPYQESRQSFDKTQTVPAEKTEFTQTQYQEKTQYQESVQTPYPERQVPERVNNEMQKNASRRPVENWRKEKPEVKEDSNKNRPKNWTRQRSKDVEVEDEDKDDKFKNRPVTRSMNRLNRRNSSDNTDNGGVQTKPVPARRHVTEVPRNQKYWDHDDRCDRDYNS